MQRDILSEAANGARLISAVVGLAFFGIGLTVLGFLWLSPFGAWDSPPIFFRIFGSFIAMVFVVIGGTTAAGVIFGKRFARLPFPMMMPTPSNTTIQQTGYHCTQCAAPLSEGADVSPLGDVKCTFCGAWFNIHQSKS